MANIRYPAIPEPSQDVASLQATIRALKEVVEILIQQRGDPRDSAVTWQDLVDKELLTNNQVPRKFDRR